MTLAATKGRALPDDKELLDRLDRGMQRLEDVNRLVQKGDEKLSEGSRLA